MRALERRAVGGRQDHDRRKHDRRRARARRACDASPAACRAGRVTSTPTPASGPARRRAGGASGCTLTSRANEARGAAREEIVGELVAERGAPSASATSASRSPRSTSRPSRLARRPRSHSAPSSHSAYAASGAVQLPHSVRENARSAVVASVVRAIGERRQRGNEVGAVGCGIRSRARPAPAPAGSRRARSARVMRDRRGPSASSAAAARMIAS